MVHHGLLMIFLLLINQQWFLVLILMGIKNQNNKSFLWLHQLIVVTVVSGVNLILVLKNFKCLILWVNILKKQLKISNNFTISCQVGLLFIEKELVGDKEHLLNKMKLVK